MLLTYNGKANFKVGGDSRIKLYVEELTKGEREIFFLHYVLRYGKTWKHYTDTKTGVRKRRRRRK